MTRPDGIVQPRPVALTTATKVFLRRQVRATLRQPTWVVAGLTTPLLYLALFAPLLDSLRGGLAGAPGFVSGIVNGFMPGMLVLFAYGSGTGVAWEVVADLDAGVIERFAILAGSVLRDAVMFLVPALVVVAVATLFGFHIHPLGLVLTLVLLAMLTGAVSAASAALGLTVKNIGAVAAIVTSTQLPLTLLSGVLLPVSLGPGWLRVLAHADPLYYATEAARELCNGVFGRAGWVGFGVTGGLLVLALAWATRVYQRAVA
ncbi:MAG: ABC transporter permease [Bifidobacteriaceae bacterium]|jgi:ABC-2 type transport system permease protein|nr:ABC transporter permease [Bifidobacteriaceae bacterium]